MRERRETLRYRIEADRKPSLTGEIWDLEKLAGLCEEHKRWSFFFTYVDALSHQRYATYADFVVLYQVGAPEHRRRRGFSTERISYFVTGN